jgi:tetratricopeptide (TPR) repeat protein
MTQRELAGAELSVSYVSLLEAGKRSPTAETIRILAGALSCDVGELAGPGDSGQPLQLILAQADLAMESGQVSGALERYERVLAAEPGSAELVRRARLGRAGALHRTGRLAEAARAYERCIRLGEADPANEASLRAYVGWCACLSELGELSRAADVGKAALAEFDAAQARESELSIRLISTVAGVWYELGDLREAERLLDDGLQRASRVRSPTARGAILWNASLVAYERGRYQQAIELSEEALRTFRGTSISRQLGMLLGLRGYLLLRGDPPRVEEAFDSLRQALGELAETADPVDKAYVFTELCYAYLARGDAAEAVRAAENARRLLGPDARLEFARATTALAVALAASGDRGRVRPLLTEAASILDGLGASRHAARSWIELAHVLADSGQVRDALAAHENAARALNIDDPRWNRRRAPAPGAPAGNDHPPQNEDR